MQTFTFQMFLQFFFLSKSDVCAVMLSDLRAWLDGYIFGFC
jgi:hypothetical protein